MMTVCKQIFREILNSLKSVARQTVALFVSISLTFNPLLYQSALANPSNIVPDGTTQTTIELSPNNVTVVNIATPTGSGTSMNNFDQFNVDQTGAILNNSSVVVNTQLGGWIYANTHLSNGNQASVIVGEVTGSMPSSLLGYTEIAGGKAEFVLLNPNGIACQGCGFINLSSLTLATGSGIYNADGSLASVNMGAGNFSVAGVGLDATLVDYFRVISKNVQLSAPIWAKDELEIYQGSSNFNTTSNIFSGTPNPQAGQTIGIDVAALGAMYAGKATLVASDLGLGVNIASDVIASSGGITITANGDIVYNNLTSATNTIITANNGGNITQNGDVKSSTGNTNLTAANNVSIAGSSLSSTGNTNITAGGNISNSNNLSLKSTNLTTASTGNTTLQNLNATVSGQTNITANNLTVTGSNIASTGGFISNVTNTSNLNNTIVSSSGNASLTTKDLILQTAVVATSGGITENASGNITQDNSRTIATNAITINASSLTNQNSSLIQTANALNITLTLSLNNTGSSSIASSLNATITAVNGTNSTNSYIVSGGNFNGSFSGTLSNSAKIAAIGSIAANNLNNQNGYLEAGTSVLITNNNFGLNNASGTIQSDNGNLTIASNYQFNNTNGKLNSSNDINLNIKANQNYTDTNSQINAGGSVYLNSAGYDITEGSGVKFQTSNLFQVTAANFTNNSDINVGYLDLNLSNALTNNANLVSTANSQYIIRRNIVNTGTIASGTTLLLQGANITNANVGGSTGLIYSAGNMEVAGSTSITNNANSAIVSGGTLGIYADTLITNGSNAQMWSVGNLILAGYGNTSVATFNNGSTSGAAYLKYQANMQINAGQINNIGKDNAPLIEGDDTTPYTTQNAYTVDWTPNKGDAPMDTSWIIREEFATNTLTSTNSQIVAGGSMLINGNVLNQTGDILAGTNLTINGNVTNNVTHFTTRSLTENWGNTYEDCVFGAFGGVFCSTEHNYWNGSHTNTFSSLTPSRIAAGGNLTISGSQISNDSGTATFQNNTPLGGSSGGTNSGYSGSYATSFANSNALNSSNIASPNLNFNALTNPTIFNVSQNPPSLNLTNANGQNINFTYLYEANPAFNVQSNFLTSDYFFTHLNYNPSRQIVMIGDPYTERRIVEDTIAKTGMVQYLGNGAIDGLYANGLKYLEGRPTQVGYELSQTQINALTEDVIIPVQKEINGKTVMVPQVYFSAATLAKAKELDKAGGQIYAGGNITLTSNRDLINKGYIASGGKMTLNASGDIINTGGELTSGQSMILSGTNVLLDALTTDNTTKPRTVTLPSFFGHNLTRTITDAVTSSQIQNVSKVDSGGSLIINAANDFTAKGASIKAKDDAQITAEGNVTLAAAYSNSSFDVGDVKETSSKSVNTIIQTGTQDATPKLIQKAENDQKIQDINVSLAGLVKQKTDAQDLLNKSGSDDFMSAFVNIPALQAKLTSLNSQIDDKRKQVADLKTENLNLLGSIANTTGGDVTITAGKDVNIEAGTDTQTSHYHTSDSGFFGSTTTTTDTQTSQVMSSLISGNNVNISSNQDINVLASIITGGGDGNLSANNDINIQALQNLYYNYYFHQETQMDIGALALQIAIAVAVSVATAGAGAALMASVVMSTALATTAATAALIAVGTQYGMSAAMSGGEHGTEQIQSGDADSTTTRSSTLITSSLLFGGNLTLGAGNNANTQTANIKADNVTQEVKQSSTTSQVSTHTDIEPDYGSIAKGAAITGFVAGGTEVAGAYISKVKANYLAKHPEAKWMEKGQSNLKPGLPSESKIGVNVIKDGSGQWIKESTGEIVSPTYAYTIGNQNPIFQGLNMIPGMPSFSYFHDAALTGSGDLWTAVSIAPYLPVSYFDACGALCAGAITDSKTETQKDTTINTITINN